MKFLLSCWLQNIHFSPFLWIPADSSAIPADSGGMAPFLQESVGQGKVLEGSTTLYEGTSKTIHKTIS